MGCERVQAVVLSAFSYVCCSASWLKHYKHLCDGTGSKKCTIAAASFKWNTNAKDPLYIGRQNVRVIGRMSCFPFQRATEVKYARQCVIYLLGHFSKGRNFLDAHRSATCQL